MEPFTILCETCAARLKVTQPKAIGQKLACPKCNSMVLVEAPEGIEIPRETGTLTEASFDFDDIEKILENPTSRPKGESAPKPIAGQPTTPPQDAAPPLRAPSRESASKRQEVAPALGSQWTTAEAKSRKKWVIAGSMAIGSLVVVLAIIGAIIGNSTGSKKQKSDLTVAAASQAEATNHPTEEPAPDLAKPSSTDSTNSTDSAETGTSQSSETKTKVAPESQRATDKGNSEASPALPPQQPSPADPPEMKPDAVTPTPPEEQQPKPANGLDSLLIGLNKSGGDSVLNSNLGELSNLLEQKGTSILEINDVAAIIRNSQMIGLPKYHFEKPEPFDTKLLERLQDSCAGVQYKATPMIVALREISLITGVPFQLDVDSISGKNINLSTPVDIKVVDTDFLSIVEELVRPLELTVVFDGTEIPWITPIDHLSRVEVQYEIPKLSDPDGKKIAQFVDSIKNFIAPSTWTMEENPPTIEVLENQLVINQTPAIHSQIRAYLEKIRAGLKLTKSGLASENAFPNRWVQAQTKTAKPFTGQFRIPVSLETMLNRIQQVADVNVVVDWATVLPTGWTPQTMVPGQIDEQSTEEALRQLVRTMGLTSRFINENTIEITTFESAAKSTELEVYSCHKILKGNLTASALMQALEGALDFNLNRLNNIRVVYEPECQCVIAVAPQLVQRQIHAILQRLGAD